MSKIKLINYPYKDFQVGDVVDLGEEKNRSMVALTRAVFIEEDSDKTKAKEPVVQEPKLNKKKKLITNTLKEQIQEQKTEVDVVEVVEPVKTPVVKKSIWDRLK